MTDRKEDREAGWQHESKSQDVRTTASSSTHARIAVMGGGRKGGREESVTADPVLRWRRRRPRTRSRR